MSGMGGIGRVCSNCLWVKKVGIHYGCYFVEKFRRWLPSDKVKSLAMCELVGCPSVLNGCKWVEVVEVR